jgi:hypothetical protein
MTRRTRSEPTKAHSDKMESRHVPFPSFLRALLSSGLLLLLSACITAPSNPAATQPATKIDPHQADPAYWLARPAVASATSDNYDRLWDASEKVARDDLFPIDRRDYRDGVLTTEPVISKQFFEFWRDDVLTAKGLARSSLQTIRRSIHFDFIRLDSGGWSVSPKVVVEQFASAGRRITYVGAYQSITDPGGTVGSTEADEGIYITAQYWFAIGRDPSLERKLAKQIEQRVQ